MTNVVILDDEKDNVVSTLSNVVYINVEMHNVDSTLFDVVISNVEIHIPGTFFGKRSHDVTWRTFRVRLRDDVGVVC